MSSYLVQLVRLPAKLLVKPKRLARHKYNSSAERVQPRHLVKILGLAEHKLLYFRVSCQQLKANSRRAHKLKLIMTKKEKKLVSH